MGTKGALGSHTSSDVPGPRGRHPTPRLSLPELVVQVGSGRPRLVSSPSVRTPVSYTPVPPDTRHTLDLVRPRPRRRVDGWGRAVFFSFPEVVPMPAKLCGLSSVSGVKGSSIPGPHPRPSSPPRLCGGAVGEGGWGFRTPEVKGRSEGLNGGIFPSRPTSDSGVVLGSHDGSVGRRLDRRVYGRCLVRSSKTLGRVLTSSSRP